MEDRAVDGLKITKEELAIKNMKDDLPVRIFIDDSPKLRRNSI